jgi:hypothetical protein
MMSSSDILGIGISGRGPGSLILSLSFSFCFSFSCSLGSRGSTLSSRTGFVVGGCALGSSQETAFVGSRMAEQTLRRTRTDDFTSDHRDSNL